MSEEKSVHRTFRGALHVLPCPNQKVRRASESASHRRGLCLASKEVLL